MTRDEFINLKGQLSGVGLSDIVAFKFYLRGADLRGANLGGANLSGANLSGADLRDAYLRGANLSGANLRYADLSGANLKYADLSGANISHVNLRGARLHNAIGYIDAGYDPHGFHFRAVLFDDGIRISAGCRYFTLAEARRHWFGNGDALARVSVLSGLQS